MTKPNKSGIPNVVPIQGYDPSYVFRYYVYERERIRIEKDIKKNPPPHTDDPILRKFSFCNIFRQHDKVTRHYLKWIEPLVDKWAENPTVHTKFDVIVNTIYYRIFNWPPTMTTTGHLNGHISHNTKRLQEQREDFLTTIMKRREDGEKVYTGAYIIPNDRMAIEKPIVCFNSIDQAYLHKRRIVETLDENSLEEMWRVLKMCVSLCGPFIGYEIVTDLSYNILANAADKFSWANAGPGAKRGINWLQGVNKRRRISPDDCLFQMKMVMKSMEKLFDDFNRETKDQIYMRQFGMASALTNMRTAEHTLCEYDKYMRVLYEEGRPRATYKPSIGEFPL